MRPRRFQGTGSSRKYLQTILATLCLLLAASPAWAQDPGPQSAVELVTPAGGSEVIDRRPEIAVRISQPFAPDTLYIYLDGVDLSGLAEVSASGFELQPVAVVASGDHSLIVMATGQGGQQIYAELHFTSRHSQSFDELSSTNELTARYQAILDKPHDVSQIPYSALDANLATSSRLKKEAWQLSLDGNIRYVDQNLAVAPPLYKGANVNNYTARLERNNQQGGYHLLAEVGDVQVNESATTIQNMARRGGKVTVDYRDVAVSGFVVKSAPVYGFRSDDDGFGIDSSDDDHLMGISAKVGFMANRVTLKSLYATGGESGSGFGLYSEQGGSKGHVAGAILQTDFFNQKLITEQEFMASTFDADTADVWDSEDDKAYRIGVSGTLAKYFYQAAYEYFGPSYKVAGQYITSDREGFVVNCGANYQTQNIVATISQHHDNVEDDDLYPAIYTSQGALAYTYSAIQYFPLGLNYAKTIIDSTSEPLSSPEYRLDTDMVSATLSYYKDTLNVTLQPSYSLQNDRLSDYDTSNRGLAITSNYGLAAVNIASLLSFDRAKYHATGDETDTYLVNLQFQGRLLDDHLGYGFGGSYTLSDANNGVKSDIMATDFEVAYSFNQGAVAERINPSVGIRTTYQKTKDYSTDNENEELVFYLVLSSRVPFAL